MALDETKNQIILSANTELIDVQAREFMLSLQTKVDTINERTKHHTIQIRELQKEIKGLINLIRTH